MVLWRGVRWYLHHTLPAVVHAVVVARSQQVLPQYRVSLKKKLEDSWRTIELVSFLFDFPKNTFLQLYFRSVLKNGQNKVRT